MIWATIGGICVAFGLIIEKVADWMDEKFLGGYRVHKGLEFFGWNVLLLGIFIEIADAGWTAHEVWQNQPSRQPVVEIRASLWLQLSSAKYRDDTKFGLLGEKATMWLGKTDNTNIEAISFDDFDRHTGITLASSEIVFNNKTNPFECSAEFTSSFEGMSTVLSTTEPITAETIKKWNTALILLPIEGKTDFGGIVEVFMNSAARRYVIEPQQFVLGKPIVASSDLPRPKK